MKVAGFLVAVGVAVGVAAVAGAEPARGFVLAGKWTCEGKTENAVVDIKLDIARDGSAKKDFLFTHTGKHQRSVIRTKHVEKIAITGDVITMETTAPVRIVEATRNGAPMPGWARMTYASAFDNQVDRYTLVERKADRFVYTSPGSRTVCVRDGAMS